MTSYTLLSFLLCSFALLETSYPSFMLIIVTSCCYLLVSTSVCSSSAGLLSFLVMCLFGLTSIFFSTLSLLIFYISFELRLLPVLLIILVFGYQPEKVRASFFLLLYTAICSLPFLYFVCVSGFSIYNTFG